MHIKTLAAAFIFALSFFSGDAGTLGAASRGAVQRAAPHKRKRARPVLELPSPKKNLVVVFSDPLPYTDFGERLWRKIIIRHKHFSAVVEDLTKLKGGHEAFLAETDATGWSPDGRYLIVSRAYNTSPDGKMEKTEYEFLDLCTWEWVYFRSKEGESVTIPSFIEWRKDQPHTMVFTDHHHKDAEAYPVPESGPDCETQ